MNSRIKEIAIMTGKSVFWGFTIGVVIVAVGGCAIYQAISSNTAKDDAVREWATTLGTTEGDMFMYLTHTTGIQDREQLNRKLLGKPCSWSAFYTRNDPAFDNLLRRYEGTERNRNLQVRASLHRLAGQMARVRMSYIQGNQAALNSQVYGGLLQELAGPAFARLDELSAGNPDSPFIENDDAETWALVRRFVAALEKEAGSNPDLSKAFSGIRFNETLMVVERMRYEDVVEVLLINLPTHQALGDLFKALEQELPRP